MTEQLKIQVVSDGTPKGTRFLDQDGNELRTVTRFHITGNPGEMVMLELEMMLRPIEICAQPHEMVMCCEVCGYESETHNCLTKDKV